MVLTVPVGIVIAVSSWMANDNRTIDVSAYNIVSCENTVLNFIDAIISVAF